MYTFNLILLLMMKNSLLNKLDLRPLKCKLKWIKLLLKLMLRELNNKDNTKHLFKTMTQHLNYKVS